MKQRKRKRRKERKEDQSPSSWKQKQSQERKTVFLKEDQNLRKINETGSINRPYTLSRTWLSTWQSVDNTSGHPPVALSNQRICPLYTHVLYLRTCRNTTHGFSWLSAGPETLLLPSFLCLLRVTACRAESSWAQLGGDGRRQWGAGKWRLLQKRAGLKRVAKWVKRARVG